MTLAILEKNLLIILVPVVSWYIANIISPMFKIKIKPFVCAKCMGLWIGFFASVLLEFNYILIIPIAFTTSTLSIIFERWISRL